VGVWQIANVSISTAKWLVASVGGIFISYLSYCTILVFHATPWRAPGPDAFLITGTVALVLGAYELIDARPTTKARTTMLISGPLLIMLVYGVGICMQIAPSERPGWVTWPLCILLAGGCLLWSYAAWRTVNPKSADPGADPSNAPRDLQTFANGLPGAIAAQPNTGGGVGDETNE
jgi:hypothetical protein